MIDKVEVVVQGGYGGDGLISFRREKYVPFGGPDGGDGGVGGDVFIMASPDVADLSLLKREKKFTAGCGGQGGRQRKRGKEGQDLTILVPAGTMAFTKTDGSEEETLIADFTAWGQKVLVARGGNGGLGNVHFATAADQAPTTRGKGGPGEECHILLELKFVTDICIIGYPNSGKSTLLSIMSRARPKIADYPFTTRQPVLGVIQSSKRDFIVAEIPALVEGASRGKGLGSEFLRHVGRTKVVIYLLDGTSPTVVEDLSKLNEELALYKADLLRKAKIVAVNKVDLPQVQACLPDIGQSFNELGWPIFYVSAANGQGVLELTGKAMEMVERASEDKEMVLPPYVPRQIRGGDGWASSYLVPRQINGGVDEGPLTSPRIFHPRPRK